MPEELVTTDDDAATKSFEIICGVVLSIFAGILALSSLGGSNADVDAIRANTNRASAYEWYSSKGIKEDLAEGARSDLESFLTAGVIAKEHTEAIQSRIRHYGEEVARFKKEKREILLGSAKVGQANWAQDVDGKFGQITGAKEYEDLSQRLTDVGDIFDLASLFLQLCLIMGALSIVLQTRSVKWSFFAVMSLMGMVGAFYCAKGYLLLLG